MPNHTAPGREALTTPSPSAAVAIRSHAGAHAHDTNDRIIYNPNTGALLYDSNGNAGGHETPFALLAKHLALTAADFIVF